MAYEIINQAQVTPHRLYALLRLVAQMEEPNKEKLVAQLQPMAIHENKDAFNNVYDAAFKLQLIKEHHDSAVKLTMPLHELESMASFRMLIRRHLAGVTSSRDTNFLLNQVAAWYAVLDERVFQLMRVEDLAALFNERLYPNAKDRVFNSTKLAAWRTWAAFIGWGWIVRLSGQREVLAPDAYDRVASALPDLKLPVGEKIEFGIFMQRLSTICPELDGGSLFEQCWQASRGGEEHGSRLSLMLSTGLRALNDTNRIALIRLADAPEIWTLYPAVGHSLRDVSHISLGVN